jgi:hypothetical protein
MQEAIGRRITVAVDLRPDPGKSARLYLKITKA